MGFFEKMKENANYTRTLNGAVAHASTGEACLDFFAVAGGMRYRKRDEQIRLFERAYIEDPELAMKLLFHIRDIRQGMGERQMFRTLLRHIAFTWPNSARKNAQYIAEYGRFDDLFCLLETPAHASAVQVIKEQLEKDMLSYEKRQNGDIDAPISLLAKWMPSDNASSSKTRKLAGKMMAALHMEQRRYRKMLTSLRSSIALTEKYLTKNTIDKVRYEAVPAQAMMKYRNAFERKDRERFSGYIANVIAGKEKMHADTLFPYEVLRPYFRNFCITTPNGEMTLEALWKSMSAKPGNDNALSVIDTSGSMYCPCGKDAPIPALISQAMGIYAAERCTGVFHNKFITFESKPHVMELKGNTLRDKLKYLQGAPWGGSTNLSAVFKLILDTAVKNNMNGEEMPKVLYIFSDMEFNCAMGDADKTVYEDAKEMFEAYGYRLPAVVFHNVNSWQMQAPVTAHTNGAALVSGASVHSLTEKFDGNVTPISHMLRVLNGKRYEVIHA